MDATSRFSDRAGHYAAHRPGYSNEVVDLVLAPLNASEVTVADVGAGTGISSRAVAQAGCCVLAVEPNEAMRGRAEPHAKITWRAGTATDTGLETKSVDVAAAFQAFHWFATEDAMRELERIARKRIAVVQYERDERGAFTLEYGQLVRQYATDDTEALRAQALVRFEAWGGRPAGVVHGPQTLDWNGLLGRVASASYLPHDGRSAQQMQRELRRLFERCERDGIVELQMQTTVMTKDLA